MTGGGPAGRGPWSTKAQNTVSGWSTNEKTRLKRRQEGSALPGVVVVEAGLVQRVLQEVKAAIPTGNSTSEVLNDTVGRKRTGRC